MLKIEENLAEALLILYLVKTIHIELINMKNNKIIN